MAGLDQVKPAHDGLDGTDASFDCFSAAMAVPGSNSGGAYGVHFKADGRKLWLPLVPSMSVAIMI